MLILFCISAHDGNTRYVNRLSRILNIKDPAFPTTAYGKQFRSRSLNGKSMVNAELFIQCNDRRVFKLKNYDILACGSLDSVPKRTFIQNIITVCGDRQGISKN